MSLSSTFILTSAVKQSYQRVLLASSQKWPVLLYGPSGSGKSALIAKLAEESGNKGTLYNLPFFLFAHVYELDLVEHVYMEDHIFQTFFFFSFLFFSFPFSFLCVVACQYLLCAFVEDGNQVFLCIYVMAALIDVLGFYVFSQNNILEDPNTVYRRNGRQAS